MQTAPQIIPSETTNPDAGTRLRGLAHRLAKTHDAILDPERTRHLPRVLLPGMFLSGRDSGNISQPKRTDLLKDLLSWEQALRSANAIFKSMPAKDLPVSRAAEWMLDNFYVVKQTLRQIDEDLPASFLNQLPILAGTSLQGHSRVFALAREWIGYSQSQIDLLQTAAFVQEYQQVTPLTIGELWALPIMLRIGILERLVYAAAELTGIN
ncbi:MAG TPA: hypothetical protein VJL10_04545, partial [Anaerolineales bacterium]|nr:hypothetical protein [Anaerolineales bacterium]